MPFKILGKTVILMNLGGPGTLIIATSAPLGQANFRYLGILVGGGQLGLPDGPAQKFSGGHGSAKAAMGSAQGPAWPWEVLKRGSAGPKVLGPSGLNVGGHVRGPWKTEEWPGFMAIIRA